MNKNIIRWYKNVGQPFRVAYNKAEALPRILIFSVCLIPCLVQTVQAQTAILEYKFNETGSTAPSTGSNATVLILKDSSGAATDLHSADSLGVSGLAGDRAFDNTGSTSMGGSGGRAEQADLAAIDTLKSFTLQGWFKTDGISTLGTNARLFHNFAGSNGFDLYGKSTINGDMTLGVDNGDADTSGAIYGDTQTWIFFAVTYDGTLASNNVKFYKGSGISTVTQIGTHTVNKSAVDNEGTGLGIGNKSGSSNFPFDGFLDNIRIFGSQSDNSGALTLSQLETFRSGDVPPSVISTSPANGVTGVGTNVVVTATFSEAMQSSTINTDTFTVRNGSSNISGTVSYSGTTATFTPSANLSASTTYTATVTTGAKDSTGASMASNYTWSFTTGSGPDTTPPTDSSTIPANGATDVAINSSVRVTFSEAMDAATITTSTFTVNTGSNNISGSVSYSGTTATFTPSSNFDRSTTYTVMITTGVKDLTGNAMVTSYYSSFTTGSSPDNAPPQVASTSPSNGATGVAINSVIIATFSEAMDTSTISTSTFTVSKGGSNISGAVSYSGTTATFTPSAALDFDTIYTATITTGVKDLAGNAINSNSTWSFTTTSLPSTPEPPPTEEFTVTSVSPEAGDTDIPIDTLVLATFSMFINGSTFNTDTFKLSDGVNEVTGTVTTDGATAIFTPLSDLAYNTAYTARVTTGAQAANYGGTTLDNDCTWSFTTIPDTIQPTVISTSPANSDTEVPIDSIITVMFSEEMDTSTIATDTFIVNDGSGDISGIVSYSGAIATFTPSGNLSDSTAYTVRITTGAKDLAGNAMASPYTWSFTTGDFTAPTVISTSPVNGATGVAIDSVITVTFSDVMDASTITTNTFTLSDGSGNISGTGSYSGMTVTFTQSANLDFNTTYTTTVTTGVKDLNGNAMTSDYTWSFTTISALPTPTITPTPTATATTTPTSTATPTPTVTATPAILTGNITGRVMDAVTKNGINGAIISMAGQTVAMTRRISDITGTYVIQDVSVGGYTLTASATGYQSSSQEVTVASGETTTANFTLEPVTTPTPTPTVTATPESCDVATAITSSSSTITVEKGNSTTVTITVTGVNGCAVVDDTIKASVNDSSTTTVSPSKVKTDANGRVTFTITGNNNGSAKVTFKESTANLKTKATVSVTK